MAWFFFGRRGRAPLSPLASIAFVFMISGIVFGDNRWFGYGLIGIGMVIAVVDIIRKQRGK